MEDAIILAMYLDWGRPSRASAPEFWSFHKNDCKIQKKKTFKAFLLENLLFMSLDHCFSWRQCHQLSESTMLRCQFMFYKQCSEAHFTCHINPLSLGRDTKIASLDRSLMLADILQQRDFTFFLFVLKILQNVVLIDIICFWLNNKSCSAVYNTIFSLAS